MQLELLVLEGWYWPAWHDWQLPPDKYWPLLHDVGVGVGVGVLCPCQSVLYTQLTCRSCVTHRTVGSKVARRAYSNGGRAYYVFTYFYVWASPRDNCPEVARGCVNILQL
jgi:hypothetical protein